MDFRKATTTLMGMAMITALCLVFAGGAMAAGDAKSDWKFHDIVDFAFVKQHVTIPMPDNVMLIDSRPARAKYDKGHIPMAVSIPDSKFDKMIDKLPKDKSALLIFYCQGPT